MKIRVDRKGNRFTLNGKRKVLQIYDGFAVMAYLDRWARGEREWLGAVERHFDRINRMGLDGVRLFGETTGWGSNGDHPFFKNYATDPSVWNYRALRNEDRPRSLQGHYQKMILKLIQLLQEHGLIAEFTIDATLKHDGVSTGMISHCIRQVARFLRFVEEGENEYDEHDGWVIKPRLFDKFSHVMGDINMFVELHNEWDAHNQAGLTLNELNMQFYRLRRFTDQGEPEQFPRVIAGVSHGGKDEVDYNMGRDMGADYVALHPRRDGEWWKRTDLERRYRSFPRYYNESKNYCSPAEWAQWVETGAFSFGSSTKDKKKYLRFAEETLDNGISFCYHTTTGMAASHDPNGDELPWTPLELALKKDAPPPPPPPPPPPEKSWWERLIEILREILGR